MYDNIQNPNYSSTNQIEFEGNENISRNVNANSEQLNIMKKYYDYYQGLNK